MSRPLHRVRTTRRPDLVIEVDDATLTDLQRRGQLLPLDEPPPTEHPPGDDAGTPPRELTTPAAVPTSRRRRGARTTE